MAKQVISVGTVANDDTGDLPRPAWTKANDNFTELYSNVKIGRITPSITASQNDYSPTGWDDASYVDISSDSSAWQITGFAAPTATGKTIKTIYNSGSTVLSIPIESTSSSAANRVKSCSKVIYIHPGCSFTMEYNSSVSRWMSIVDVCSQIWNPDPRTKFVSISDCGEAYGGNTPYNTNSGTGTVPAASTTGIFAQKALGVYDISTGSTTTGRSGLTLSNTIAITCALGRYIGFARVAVSALSTSGEEYTAKILGLFAYTTVPSVESNGIFWGYERAVDGDFFLCFSCNNSSRTKVVTGVAPSTTFIYLGIITNDDWTAVEFVYSTDGLNWTRAALNVTNNPTTARSAPLMVGNIIKSAGSTPRIISLDSWMVQYNFLRG